MFVRTYLNVFFPQRLGVSFDEYHGESMYHKQSLEVIEQFKSRGLLRIDRLVSRLLLSCCKMLVSYF